MPTIRAKSALGNLGKQFRQAFARQSIRKEQQDNSLVIGTKGEIYRLESVLGVGGLSVVYRAVRLADRKEVALKIANLNKAPDAAPLIAREAELLSRLNHPNIVKMLDSGTTVDGEPFFAMELLRGQTLEQQLISEKYLDLMRAARICMQIAAAVQHAHDRGILHRDIKPSNIMLVKKNGLETAVIYDFGISLSVDENGISYDESSSGSLQYVSPEQLTEGACSYNTDVYQLALVLFESITGRLPFQISVSGALAYRNSNCPVLISNEELAERRLPDNLRKVLEDALERNPGRRTGNMRCFAAQLNLALCQPHVKAVHARVA